ncbi:40S ribosomal protein S8 (nucleomorph) [Cryptomonas paramecium]|uniref:40S ribosomal protein S8 n=1 Tax=Cryptomonas paramaecium TaxID=2898 RepID=F2HIC0_9CRYP|nr:40S ribosomal protein S8 [Cryptomonas paramecium]AEA39044.1 40S ribosomal protein S8 [Cryptomonas paramecium]|mmetsp:Transcript_52135/g.136254  ORF Transcript_52135/g.136254 Transcript_52135/m.136254 type:complete len:178 (-) Transcript_52135:10089-10622(-)
MVISRDKCHKRKLTGGKKNFWRKKKKHNAGRQFIGTKIGLKHIAIIRVRGGNFKKRALYLEKGNFSWISYNITKKSKIISVVYNSSNNEFVRTNTLVKSSIVYIDVTPFRNVFQEKKLAVQNASKNFVGNKVIDRFFKLGKILARICSRPGQTGRADGYVIENEELEFYQKKIQKKT